MAGEGAGGDDTAAGPALWTQAAAAAAAVARDAFSKLCTTSHASLGGVVI